MTYEVTRALCPKEELCLDDSAEGSIVPFRGGSSKGSIKLIDEPIDKPLMNHEKWLTGDELSELANVSSRMGKKAIAAKKWRGCELLVRRVPGGRGGAGGMVPQVHVDSLPHDIRAAWYLARGVVLGEKVDAATGAVIEVADHAYVNDPAFDKKLALARFRHDLIRGAVAHPARSEARAKALADLIGREVRFPCGKRKVLKRAAVYNWVKAYEAEGLIGLIRKERSTKGQALAHVSKAWDGVFLPALGAAPCEEVAGALVTYMRSLWAAGESGWRAVSEKSTTRLLELSRDLNVAAFDALPVGRLGDGCDVASQFGVCHVPRRKVEGEREYRLLAVKSKDNARFEDYYAPSIRRDYSDLVPRQIVVGDVHPVDVMMRREDGTMVYPKAIAWYDVATNEIHMTFVLCEPNEGIRREHIAMSFQAMVLEWGLPQMLYLDNGSEYSWDAMIDGFTQLSKLTSGAVKVSDLAGDARVHERVAASRQAVLRSQPYNAKGKPGIEGAFGNLERGFFSMLQGWTAGDRMSKKTHAKGKDPIAFSGTFDDFLDEAEVQLDWYHKRPQHGRLAGQSPNDVLRSFIEGGWGKTELSNIEVLALAFSEVVERTPDRGRISYTPTRGGTLYFYDDALLGIDRKITVRVPAFKPDFVFCFIGEQLICRAALEQTYGVLDLNGAREVNRRGKALRRQLGDMRKNVAHLSLTDETKRHTTNLPDAPDAPVAAVIDTGMLDRMRAIDAEARQKMAQEHNVPKQAPQQWKVAVNDAVANYQFLEDEDE